MLEISSTDGGGTLCSQEADAGTHSFASAQNFCINVLENVSLDWHQQKCLFVPYLVVCGLFY